MGSTFQMATASNKSQSSTQMRSSQEPTELSIIESFDSYYRRDYRSLLGLAYVLTGSSGLSEDIVQEALTEAHRRWEQVSRYEDPGAWVRRVMVNKSRSRFRKLRSEARALTRLGGRPEEVIRPSERVVEVWAAVRDLPTRQCQAIALHYWEDCSLAQIARIMGCGEETVKTHLKRGRAALAKELKEQGLKPVGLMTSEIESGEER